jgi:hypothetical protein
MRSLLAVLLLAPGGCDFVFRIDRLGPPGDARPDVPIDAPIDAPTILTCAKSPIILRPTEIFLAAWADQYPATGNHLDQVIDDQGADEDATYIATAIDGELDLYGHVPIEAGVTIDLVSIGMRARLEEVSAPATEVATALRVDMNLYWDDRVVSSTWTDYSGALFSLNPATTQPWTVDEVNAMTFGVRKSYATTRVRVTQVWATVVCH